MRILALITARSGSKRVPLKNIRPLGGVPLIVWSIEVAKQVPTICDILVSTDDSRIAEVASAAHAMVPWLRPPELATDEAKSVDVCIHALDWYEAHHGAVDGLLLLQPTSPLRRRASVLRGIELFRTHQRRAVLGFSAAASHPMLCVRIEHDAIVPFVAGALQQRSQDLPPAYVLNGSFYLIQPQQLRTRRSFFSEDAVPLVQEDPDEAIDIDTEQDWLLAESAARNDRVRPEAK